MEPDVTTKTKKKKTRHRVGHDGLTRRERAFVHAYAKTLVETNGVGNATKAALYIGCPPASAAQRGCNFMKLSQIKSSIEALMDERLKKFDITSERVLGELAKMAFNGMSKFARKTEDGDLYFDFSEATPEELDAISELTIEEFKDGKGEAARDVRRVKFKLDRRGCLELLGKHLKLFVDRSSVENPDGSSLEAPNFVIKFVTPQYKKTHDKKSGEEAH